MRALLVRILSSKNVRGSYGLQNLKSYAPHLRRSLSCDGYEKSRILPAEFITNKGELVKIDIGKHEDYEECCAFGKNVFRTGPISMLLSDRTLEKMTFIEPWTVACLKSKISLIARNSAGSVIGVRMTDLSTVEKPFHTPPEVFQSDAMGAILDELNKGVDIFEMYKTQRAFRFVYLGVHQDYRNQGLAEKMFEISIELAKMNGADVIVVVGVHKYATRSAVNSGFRIVKTVSVSDFKDCIPPHTFSKLVADNPEASLLVRTLF